MYWLSVQDMLIIFVKNDFSLLDFLHHSFTGFVYKLEIFLATIRNKNQKLLPICLVIVCTTPLQLPITFFWNSSNPRASSAFFMASWH